MDVRRIGDVTNLRTASSIVMKEREKKKRDWKKISNFYIVLVCEAGGAAGWGKWGASHFI